MEAKPGYGRTALALIWPLATGTLATGWLTSIVRTVDSARSDIPTSSRKSAAVAAARRATTSANNPSRANEVAERYRQMHQLAVGGILRSELKMEMLWLNGDSGAPARRRWPSGLIDSVSTAHNRLVILRQSIGETEARREGVVNGIGQGVSVLGVLPTCTIPLRKLPCVPGTICPFG